jgi:hypothetical protein
MITLVSVELKSDILEVFSPSINRVSAGDWISEMLAFNSTLVEALCYKPEGRGFKSR